MPETRPLLERVMERVELRPFTLEGFLDRRDRKRRNQRIAAGVVGIAVFVAAVWIVMSVSFLDGSETSAVADVCADPVAVSSVEITGISSGYEPDCLSVDAGATITLRNSDQMSHTFTIRGTEVNYTVGGGDSSRADLSSLEPGVYDVTCVYHPSMKATLTVA